MTEKLVEPRNSGTLENPGAGSREMATYCSYVSSSCTSHGTTLFDRKKSWSRLFGESTICQRSALEDSETVVPSDCQIDHGTDRNRWSDHD